MSGMALDQPCADPIVETEVVARDNAHEYLDLQRAQLGAVALHVARPEVLLRGDVRARVARVDGVPVACGMVVTTGTTAGLYWGSYQGADHHDAHVHAAASACRADYLLTCNIGDFKVAEPERLTYEVIDADDFFLVVARSHPELVDSCISRQIQYHQARSVDLDLDGALKRAGCPNFAEHVLRVLRQRALIGR